MLAQDIGNDADLWFSTKNEEMRFSSLLHTHRLNKRLLTGRMGSSRPLLVAVVFFGLTTVIFVTIFGLAYSGVISNGNGKYNGNDASSGQKECVSQQCVEVSGYYNAKIDWSADPCDDFFQFACGKWIRENPIPGDASNYQTYSVLRNRVKVYLKGLLEQPITTEDGEAITKAKHLYSSCINTELIEQHGIQPLLNFLVDNLTWPVLNETWRSEDYNEIGTMATLQGGYSNSILVDFYVGTDDTNSSVYILQVDQGGLAMTTDYYLNYTRYGQYQDALKSLMIDIACMVKTKAGGNCSNVESEMTAAFEFEKEVAKIKIPFAGRAGNTYNKMTLRDLEDAEAPGFAWFQLANDIIQTNDISPDQVLIVRVPKYFKDLVELLNKTSSKTKQNYLVWRIVKNRINNLGEDFSNRVLEYNKVLTGEVALNERWYFCVDYVDDVLPGPAGNLFVENYFVETKKATVLDMVTRIKTAFKMLLDDEVEWMDPESKVVAREKCDYVDPKIGYAEFYKNKTFLAEDIKSYTMNELDYFGNVVNVLSNVAQADWPYIGVLVDKDSWSTPPTTVNAYYTPSLNRITFPAGELQYPFFWGDTYPFSFQFGAIGTIIGHELTHAFDNNGRQYDKDGNKLQWWTNSSITAFEEKTKCLVDQYSNYYWDTADDNLDGKNTLGENIADNGGIREAFYAYQNWIKEKGSETPLPGTKLTNDQMFFVGYANVRCGHYRSEAAKDAIKNDVHSPGKFRVIGSMSNFDEFSKVFNCPANSNMNRGADSCVVW